MSHDATISFDLNRLRETIKPYRLHWFPTLQSTNDHAAKLRRDGTLYAPAIVLTGSQTAGRGRGAHRWWSSYGSLTVTFVLPLDEAVQPHQLPLLAGLAVRRGVEKVTGFSGFRLKWPNDIYYEGRKLGGLLCERVERADLVGLGLNINVDPAEAPLDIQHRVTSLSAIARGKFDMTSTLAVIAAELHEVIRDLPQTPFPALLQEYDQHHYLVGRRVSVMDGGDQKAINGTCEGLDEMGRLLIRDRQTIHRIVAGQVVVM